MREIWQYFTRDGRRMLNGGVQVHLGTCREIVHVSFSWGHRCNTHVYQALKIVMEWFQS